MKIAVKELAENPEFVQVIRTSAFPVQGFLREYDNFRQMVLGMLPSAMQITIAHSYKETQIREGVDVSPCTVVVTVSAFGVTVTALIPEMVYVDILNIIVDTLRSIETEGYRPRFDGNAIDFNDLLVYAISGTVVEEELDGDTDDHLLLMDSFTLTFTPSEVELVGIRDAEHNLEVNVSTRDGRRLVSKAQS